MCLGLISGIFSIVMLAGYLVLVKAHVQKGGLKIIGQIISWIVIIMAFAGIICTTLVLHCRSGKSYYDKTGHGRKCGLYSKQCPFIQKEVEVPAEGKGK